MGFDILTRAVVALATTLQGKVPKDDIVNQAFYPYESDGSLPLGMFGALPSMQEVGKAGLNLEDFAEYSFAVLNKNFATSVLVDELDMSRDLKTSGALRRHLNTLAHAPLKHIRAQFATLLANGTSLPTGGATTFDTVAFFSASHSFKKSKYKTSQSNLLSTAIADKDAPTIAETKAAIDGIRTKFNTFKDDQGEIYHDNGQSGLVAIVPDSMRSVFEDVLMVEDQATGGKNKYYKMMDLLVEPRLTATDAFYVVKLDGGEAKPFIKQWEKVNGQEFRSEITKDGDSFIQKYDKRIWDLKSRYALGYFIWLYAVKQVFTTST